MAGFVALTRSKHSAPTRLQVKTVLFTCAAMSVLQQAETHSEQLSHDILSTTVPLVTVHRTFQRPTGVSLLTLPPHQATDNAAVLRHPFVRLTSAPLRPSQFGWLLRFSLSAGPLLVTWRHVPCPPVAWSMIAVRDSFALRDGAASILLSLRNLAREWASFVAQEALRGLPTPVCKLGLPARPPLER